MAATAAPRGWQWGEQRPLGRAVRLLQRLEEQCGDPRLAMGPPSLRDLLPRTAQLLLEVAKAWRDAGGRGPEGPGGAWDFLQLYLANLEAKGRQVAALLPSRGRGEANDELFREGSRLSPMALDAPPWGCEVAGLPVEEDRWWPLDSEDRAGGPCPGYLLSWSSVPGEQVAQDLGLFCLFRCSEPRGQVAEGQA